jgi:Xaa-Pro dipeptidase
VGRGVKHGGLTEGRLAGAIKARYLEVGAGDSVALVASGANGSKAHYLGDGAIAPNQPLLVDTGSAIDGYWSGTTRMFFPEGLEPDADRAYEAVCSAYEAAFDRVAPGVPAQEIDRAARRVITEAGFGDYFHHRTGHGVGLKIHEVPYIREGNVEPLEVGNVFSIEPGIYVAGRFGLRYENLVFVSEQGAQPLNRTPRRHALLT